jgi:simple sugar transport system permease protein
MPSAGNRRDASAAGRIRHLLRADRGTEGYLLLVILALGLVLSLGTEEFFTLQNLVDLLTGYAFVGVLAAGLLVVLVSGSIDISFTATASVAQYVMMLVLISYGGNWLVAFLLAGAIGAALGAVNALLVYYLRVSSIIITIATLNVFFGLLIFATKGAYIYDFPEWFSAGFSLYQYSNDEGNYYSLSLQIVVLLVVFALTYLLLNRTTVGRQIYALGSNPEAAKRLGFNILWLQLFVYCYMGLMAGVASVIQAQLAQSIAPTILVGKELDVLAAVVLGGASLTGGVGSVGGTILGIALLAMLQNGLILLGVSSYWSTAFTGVVIIASVSATAYSGRIGRLGSAR